MRSDSRSELGIRFSGGREAKVAQENRMVLLRNEIDPEYEGMNICRFWRRLNGKTYKLY